MRKLMRKCPKCGRYTLEPKCPRCGSETVSPPPPKFSPQDRYALLRLKALYEDQSTSL